MRSKLGLEILLESRQDLLAGKRLALLACPSSVDWQLVSSVERLRAHPAVNLVALFGPEHGIRGEAQAGQKVATSRDRHTGLPVHSLYGATQSPSADMLSGIDTILIDLQDGGVRFYTYLATALTVMRAAREAGISVILLDRPTPISGARVEGPMLAPGYRSFVGPARLPIRYGMTLGETALMLNEQEGINCALHVVAMTGWARAMWYDETGLPFVPSSPNLPTLDAMTLYPGTCLVEGTNLSEGRGTTKPFEYIGAPWIDDAEALAAALNAREMPGLRFRPVYFVPSFSKYQGEVCAGVQVYVSDRDACAPIPAMLQFLRAVKARYPADFAWRPPWAAGSPPPIDLLWGSDSLRQHIDKGDTSAAAFISSWQPALREFLSVRARYLLY